jgi:hypothetical protein
MADERHSWTFYAWEGEVFDTPEQAAELVPNEILELQEVEARLIRTRQWRVAGDGSLMPVIDANGDER